MVPLVPPADVLSQPIDIGCLLMKLMRTFYQAG